MIKKPPNLACIVNPQVYFPSQAQKQRNSKKISIHPSQTLKLRVVVGKAVISPSCFFSTSSELDLGQWQWPVCPAAAALHSMRIPEARS